MNAARECEALAKNISIRTNRSISSTTIRRFFGLLKSSSSISRYNLDTLAIYCGAPDFRSFCVVVEKALGSYAIYDANLPEHLAQITEYTLSSIKRKSLGGFENMIPRSEVNQKLNAFLESEYSIFPLIAPGGYGKSVALAHWIISLEDKYLRLFCKGGLFLSLLEKQQVAEHTIKLGLEDPGNIYNTLNNYQRDDKQVLIVVIDALDELNSDPNKLLGVLDYLFDAATIYKTKGVIKFVFSIREATWMIYIQNRFGRVETTQWFESLSPMLETGYTNLPKMSNSEIRNIISNYNSENRAPIIFECIPWNIREELRIPIQLHFIIRMFSTTNSIELLFRTNVTREYLKAFIFQSKHAEAKEDIIWKIMELMDESGDHMPISKNDLKKKYPIHLKRETAYYKAYDELLHAGILNEERVENRYGHFYTTVGFRHQNFFVYLYALYLIRENNELSSSLISAIANLKSGEAWIEDVISTLYQIAYESSNLDALQDFCLLPEKILSSLTVRLAVGTSFRNINSIRDDLVKLYAATRAGRKYFFEYYVDTNYLFNNYLMRVKEYMKHELGMEARLFGNSILYLGSFLKMDRGQCNKYSSILEAIEPNPSVHPWPIGRRVFSHILQVTFIEGRPNEDFQDYIDWYKNIAYAYHGYLKKGLVEFELYIMLALILIKDFKGLFQLLDQIDFNYDMENTDQEGAAILNRNQNAIPFLFLEYAIFKLNYNNDSRPDLLWEEAIDNYTTNFDDFQYLIFLNWFLFDYHITKDDTASALKHYEAALELARFAGYEFYMAFLLVNDPLRDSVRVKKGEELIRASGIDRELFTFPLGPCV